MAGPAVAHRAKHAHLVAMGCKKPFQKGCARCLAVGAGNADYHKVHFIRAVHVLSQFGQGITGVFMQDIVCPVFIKHVLHAQKRLFVQHDAGAPFAYGIGHVFLAVLACAMHNHIGTALCHSS